MMQTSNIYIGLVIIIFLFMMDNRMIVYCWWESYTNLLFLTLNSMSYHYQYTHSTYSTPHVATNRHTTPPNFKTAFLLNDSSKQITSSPCIRPICCGGREWRLSLQPARPSEGQRQQRGQRPRYWPSSRRS